ncbi:hypothetical protein BLNAU_9979 [Blattamonas nauphoetae]|uniref:TPX2 C-terminal domain-containing protein n=1 Tax=Blattamonas nauphoetae TaxID=2049346 RepID=A0ABQ9XU90_9EUKA|nr:hypothetical protein BLNAU_9979 [Blattamonas nauphoetae]
MEAERRVEEAKARQKEILTQQALEKERQRAEELAKKQNPSSFPPLEDYFIKPKQVSSPAKPKMAVAKAVQKKSASPRPTSAPRPSSADPTPKQAPPKSAERRSLSAKRVTPKVADRPKTGSPLSDRPKSTDKQKMQKLEDQFGELQGMLQRAASTTPSQPRSARPRTPTGVSLQQSKETKPTTPSAKKAPARSSSATRQPTRQPSPSPPAHATPKKAAAASKEGSPLATHTPPKIGSSKGKVEREKEKRSEDVQTSSPFANVERGG